MRRSKLFILGAVMAGLLFPAQGYASEHPVQQKSVAVSASEIVLSRSAQSSAQNYRSAFPVRRKYVKSLEANTYRVGSLLTVTVPREQKKQAKRKLGRLQISVHNSPSETFFHQPVFYEPAFGERKKIEGNGDEEISFEYFTVEGTPGSVRIADASWKQESNKLVVDFLDLPVVLREGMRGMRVGENRIISIPSTFVEAPSTRSRLLQGPALRINAGVNGKPSILFVRLSDVVEKTTLGADEGTIGRDSLHPSVSGTVSAVEGMTQVSQTVPHDMFGLHVPWALPLRDYSNERDPSTVWGGDWPSIPFGSVRLWDTLTTWSTLEPSKGKYDWDRLDRLVRQAKNNNVHDIVLVVAGTPTWAVTRPAPGSAEWIGVDSAAVPREEDWTRFMEALVSRYRGQITAYQIWNEPNSPAFWQGTPEELARTVSVANDIVKRIDPNAKVVSPGFAASEKFSPRTSERFWAAFAAAGFPFDAAAVHVYPSPQSGIGGFKWLLSRSKDILSLNGWTGDVWVTETSYWQREEGRTVSSQRVRELVAHSYIEASRFGVKKMFWYAWMPPQGLIPSHRLFLTMQEGTAGAAGYWDAYHYLHSGNTPPVPSSPASPPEKKCRLEGYCNKTVWDGTQWVVPVCREGFGSSWGQLGCGDMHVCIREVCE